MILALFYILALLAVAIGTAAIYMALIERFPVWWLYYHYFIRKPINWSILIGLSIWTFVLYQQQEAFPAWTIVPLLMTGIALVLTYRMHQEAVFQAVDFPEMAADSSTLPIRDDMQIAVIEADGVTKCYPLDYVIHHHIVNDTFQTKTIALTYCAMCRSIIPFYVSDIGPLFVASFKNANMIVADRKTKTFFQQATFKSIIGPSHPTELTMIPFQVLSWADVKKTIPNSRVFAVTERDFRAFQLPVPGLWQKIMGSEHTPGLAAEKRDTTLPTRTHVIGILNASGEGSLVYLKADVLKEKVVVNHEHGFFLVGLGHTVNAFKNTMHDARLAISLDETGLVDAKSGTRWDTRGKYRMGSLQDNLIPVAISDEYWFSWKKFHNDTVLVRL